MGIKQLHIEVLNLIKERIKEHDSKAKDISTTSMAKNHVQVADELEEFKNYVAKYGLNIDTDY